MFPQDKKIFNILLEIVSEAVIIVDNNQKIVEVNTASVPVFGYRKKEMISRNLNLLIPSN